MIGSSLDRPHASVDAMTFAASRALELEGRSRRCLPPSDPCVLDVGMKACHHMLDDGNDGKALPCCMKIAADVTRRYRLKPFGGRASTVGEYEE